jgi:hypothetical protein
MISDLMIELKAWFPLAIYGEGTGGEVAKKTGSI